MGNQRIGGAVLAAALVACLARSASAESARLTGVTEIARGGYLAPRVSPAGGELLATGVKYRGLYLIDEASGNSRRLVDDPGAGLHARFVDGEHIAFEARRAGARRSIVVGRDGSVRAARLAERPSQLAVARADRIYVADGGGRYRSVATGDRFFAPLVSPDGRWVAFQGLATGIYLYSRDSDRLVHVGRGTAPAWAPGSDRLVFERTEDDGHSIVASDLFLYDLASREVVRLTATDERIERRPSFDASGERVAFDDDRGAIYMARIVEGR